jgi:DNA-binding NtrC family response regulator
MNRPIQLLIVEDKEDTAALLRSVIQLRDSRIAVDIAPDLSSALHRLEQGGIDAVLCDLSLPDTTGTQAISTIRQRFYRLPLIAMTGILDTDTVGDTLRAGAGDFLEKGVLQGDLVVMTIRKDVLRKEMEAKYGEYWQSVQSTDRAIQKGEQLEEIITPCLPTKLHRDVDTATEEDLKSSTQQVGHGHEQPAQASTGSETGPTTSPRPEADPTETPKDRGS